MRRGGLAGSWADKQACYSQQSNIHRKAELDSRERAEHFRAYKPATKLSGCRLEQPGRSELQCNADYV